MRFRPLQFALAVSFILGLCVWTSRAQNAPTQAAEPVLATYQGGAISLAEYERVAATKVKQVRLILARSDERKKELLESMIDFELLLQEAKRRGYADHPKVKRAMREAEIDALAGALEVAPESVPKTDVEAALKARAAELKRPEQRRARHVLLTTQAEASALIAEARKAGTQATELLARAARERSLDEETKKKSGELGFFFASGERVGGDGKVAPELAKAAFALGKNDKLAPKPIATQGGFSVLYVTDRIEAKEIAADVAESTVRGDLARQRSMQAVDTLVAELRKAHPVETHPERVAWIELDPAAEADIPHGFPAAPKDPTAPPVMVEPDGF